MTAVRAAERRAAAPGGVPDASTALVVLAPDADSRRQVPPATVLLGVPLLRRTVLAAGRAGADRVFVYSRDAAQAAEADQLLRGTAATILTPGKSPPGIRATAVTRLVLLHANVVPSPAWLRRLFEMPVEADRLHLDPGVAGVIETSVSGALLSALSGASTVADSLRDLQRTSKTAIEDIDPTGRWILNGPKDLATAEKGLLRGLIKPTDGFMSRHINRRVSLAISRRLANTAVTPNAMTVVSVAVGLLGAPFFLSAEPAYQFAGALLFLLHSILDGCDGELARLKFLESRWGGLMDFWGDNLVHAAVFSCMAIGWAYNVQAAWPLLIGGVAVAASAGAAGLVYWKTMRSTRADGPVFVSPTAGSRRSPTGLSRLIDALARRDFIYLVVVLSAFGKAIWFLIIAAAGAPIFLAALLWVTYGISVKRA